MKVIERNPYKQKIFILILQSVFSYMYCTGEEKGAWFSQLLKIDVHTKQSWQWKEEVNIEF